MVYDDDVIRSKDMVVEIIRSNKGLGYEIVRGLAKQGLTIVLTAQDRIKGFINSRLSKLKALIQFISTN
jgi:enoyl-[acyl-carrier-protein] reductase (NADH)